MKDAVCIPHLPTHLNDLRNRITAAVNSVTQDIRHQDWNEFNYCLQGGREISGIIVTEDYLCYKEPKSPYNFFLIKIFNLLFTFKISDERQH